METIKRIFLILFCALGMIVSWYLGAMSIMTLASRANTPYTLELIAAFLLTGAFGYLIIVFFISMFKPKFIAAIMLFPVFIIASTYLEKSTYYIQHKIEPLKETKYKGKSFKTKEQLYLISNLPKIRIRNVSNACKADYVLDSQDKVYKPSKSEWQNNMKSKYIKPQVDIVEVDTKFTVIDEFLCSGHHTLMLEDENGIQIESSYIYVKNFIQ